MDKLRGLILKQHRRYRNRMQYIGNHLRWRVLMPWEVRKDDRQRKDHKST